MSNLSPVALEQLRSLLPLELVHAIEEPAPSGEAVREACALLEKQMEALLPFVPSPVRNLHRLQPTRGRIDGLAAPGTVLCADLSGFTALSAELALVGRQGSEEISTLVNSLFTALLFEVTRYGGEVIQFGGDALTAFFAASERGLEHTTCASAAALAMQAQMVQFQAVPTSRGPFPLRLRIAVDAGELLVSEVGDHFHTELVVTGSLINRVVVAQELAAPGEVIIGTTALARLGSVQVQPKTSELFLLEQLDDVPPVVPATLWLPLPDSEGVPTLQAIQALAQQITVMQPFVPHQLPPRFAYATAGGGEFRPVTVLFASFYPFAKILALVEQAMQCGGDLRIVGQVLNVWYTTVQTVVQQYGGSINKVDMATSGNRVLALFGAPVAHEDDPIRAVQAAHALRTALAEADREIVQLLQAWARTNEQAIPAALLQPSPLRFGIADGTVFAGLIGSAQRHEYTVMGATVNLAARLLHAAVDEQVLLGPKMAGAVQQVFELKPLQPLGLKGFTEPVPVFLAIRERPSGNPLRRALPMVGRIQELGAVLQRARLALKPGPAAGGVVVVTGEPGVGKSRLVNEVLHDLRAMQGQFRVVADTCQSYEQAIPYALVVRLLRQMLRLNAADDASVIAHAVGERLAALVPVWSRFTPLLASLLNLPLPETALTLALTLEQRRDRLLDLLVAIFTALAVETAQIVLIEDLHLIDASSFVFVERLGRESTGQPLLLLLVYRPVSDLAEPWRAWKHTLVVELHELAAEDSASLLRALLDGEPPPELQPLIERSEGRPFFLEETIRFLVEGGALARDVHGEWICTRPIDGSAVPTRIEQLIIARLDRLHEQTRAQAQIGSVIGQRFQAHVLATVGGSQGGLGEQMDELIQAALLLPEDDLFQLAYRFKHALIRDVAYSSLLFARRRELHLAVAAAIETLYAPQLNDYRAVLAQHYLHAECWERAFPSFIEAAQHAQTQYANREALALYQQALAIAPWRSSEPTNEQLATACTLYENLGDVLALTGSYPEAREHFLQLRSMLLLKGREDSAPQRATLERKIGSTYEHQGEPEQALLWLDHAARTVSTALNSAAVVLEQTCILNDIGWVHFRQGDLRQAQSFLEQALATTNAQETQHERARILNRLGGVAWNRGNMALAQDYVEQSLAAYEQNGDLAGQAMALNNLSILLGGQGKLAPAIQYGQQALELNERIGSRRAMAITGLNLGGALSDDGQHALARTRLTEALDRAVEVRDSYHQMLVLLSLGRVYSALQQWEDSLHVLEQSRELAQQLHLPQQECDVVVALAELALLQGDNALASDLWDQSAALPVEQESEEYGRFQRVEARLLHARGEVAGAIQLLDTNVALFTQLENLVEADRSRRLLKQWSPFLLPAAHYS